MKNPQFTSAFELKFVAETGLFEGYASVFNVTDGAGDSIAPGAFEKSLSRLQSDDRPPPMLWQHDMKEPIGAWQEIYEDGHGLFVRGALFVDDIIKAKEAYKLMRENVVTGLSIGYRAVQSRRDEETGVRVLTEIDLLEISLVTFPANDRARISAVKSILSEGRVPSEREFEAFLRDAGFSRKQAKGFISLGYKALSPRDADVDDAAALLALAEKIRNLT